MKFKYFLWLIASHSITSASAQETTNETELPIEIGASIVGALKYPGFGIGANYSIKEKIVHKGKRREVTKTVHKSRLITGSLGFYAHRDYNTNIFLQAGFQWRRQNAQGWFRTFEPRIGTSRTFIGGVVYEVSDQGDVTINKNAGHFYFAPSLSGGFGKEFSKKQFQIPFSVFTQLTLISNFPYNNFLYARVLAELGVRFKVPRLGMHQVKNQEVVKN